MKNTNEVQASLSVYLILSFTVILSLILLIVEGARQNVIRMKLECAMDLSLSSVFAEYNRELLEQYDLFFIDTSYGGENASLKKTEEHLKGYLNDNFKINEEAGILKDLTGLYTEEVSIMDYALASDEAGALIKRQAVAYMKDLYGVGYLEELQRQLNTVSEKGYFTRDVTGERLANQSAIDNVEIPPKQVSEDEWEEVELNNPADAVNASRGSLSLVIDANQELSAAAINPANYISQRECRQGSGLLGREKIKGTDELVFNEYLLKKCGCYTNPKEKGALAYQLEYILAGKSNDLENLKTIVNRLLLMKEAANVIYLFSDSAKMAEAEALAIAVTAEIPVPGLAELVKISLIFAWAYAESVYDIRTLLAGGKSPLFKTQETWHYSLSGMMDFASDTADKTNADDVQEGLSYESYLRIFLAMQNEQEKTARAMDVIEMDVRSCAGNSHFRLDTCVDYIEATVYVGSKFGYSNEITRTYYYY